MLNKFIFLSTILMVLFIGTKALDPNYFKSNHDQKIKIYFYSQDNTDHPTLVDITNPEDLQNTSFDSTKENYFYVHGFREIPFDPSSISQRIKTCVLKNFNVNFLLIDWSAVATVDSPMFYLSVVEQMPEVGNKLGNIIRNFVENNNITFDVVFLVGHSLGAHLCGIAGRRAGGKCAQILGLDPAGPGFVEINTFNRLTPDAAVIVQAIHTDVFFGYPAPLADSDWYPNGGYRQPACFCSSCVKEHITSLESKMKCSHNIVIDYYLESLLSENFKGVQCKNLVDYKMNACESNAYSRMGGFYLDKSARGSYFLETNEEPPYAINN